MAPPSIDDLLQRYAVLVGQLPNLSGLPERPTTAIISCSDPRVSPERIFNLDYREAIVFRNVAGHPQAAFKGLLAVDQFIKLKEVMVLHHTDCGARDWTDEDVRNDIRQRNAATEEEISSLGSFGAISSNETEEQSVRHDVKWLKAQKMLRKELAERTRGFVFNVESGMVTEVS
jgi:carbonic anhydrase